jgi:hypothetical protein
VVVARACLRQLFIEVIMPNADGFIDALQNFLRGVDEGTEYIPKTASNACPTQNTTAAETTKGDTKGEEATSHCTAHTG